MGPPVGYLLTFREAFTDKFVADKFRETTTHWRKLEDRVHRGLGNPCPLVLIGLPGSIVTFHEGKAALAEVETAEDARLRRIDARAPRPPPEFEGPGPPKSFRSGVERRGLAPRRSDRLRTRP